MPSTNQQVHNQQQLKFYPEIDSQSPDFLQVNPWTRHEYCQARASELSFYSISRCSSELSYPRVSRFFVKIDPYAVVFASKRRLASGRSATLKNHSIANSGCLPEPVLSRVASHLDYKSGAAPWLA